MTLCPVAFDVLQRFVFLLCSGKSLWGYDKAVYGVCLSDCASPQLALFGEVGVSGLLTWGCVFSPFISCFFPARG